jgi:hypothetical protein
MPQRGKFLFLRQSAYPMLVHREVNALATLLVSRSQ